jgi:signal transduction histidine kinase
MASTDTKSLEEDWIRQRERAVACLRVAFALIAVAVIQLNPSRVTRFPALSNYSLYSFLIYSLVALYYAWKNRRGSASVGTITTALDVVWLSVIVYSTGGTRTPFFFYYSFPVITAALRWGIKGSIPVALAGVAGYAFVRITLAAEAEATPIGMDTIVVRGLYIIVLACIFGYISEFERKQNQRLLALTKTASEVAALQERRRIMFELHDGILQSLATLILRLEGCRKRIPASEKELTGELQSVEDLTRDSMKQIRQFLAGKDSMPLVAGTLMERLREEAQFLRDGMGLTVILESDPENLEIPQEIERELYYALREGITNVTRHSHASKVEIQLSRKNGTLTGSLTDDGVGFDRADQNSGRGFGLSGMEQRVKKIGGELLVKSSPGAGTKISLVVPLALQ